VTPIDGLWAQRHAVRADPGLSPQVAGGLHHDLDPDARVIGYVPQMRGSREPQHTSRGEHGRPQLRLVGDGRPADDEHPAPQRLQRVGLDQLIHPAVVQAVPAQLGPGDHAGLSAREPAPCHRGRMAEVGGYESAVIHSAR
jgi:hypothetical protein